VFFVGIFSTHITYIIIALIYVFGYGSYALKSKSNTTNDHLDLKIIAYQNPEIICPETTYFFHKTHDCCEVIKKSSEDTINYRANFLYKELKVFDCNSWTSYHYQLINNTRPSPLFA